MTATPAGIPATIEWCEGDGPSEAPFARMIDQRRLPGELVMLDARTVDDMCDAIATLAIRGAPAIGVAGAMGVALAHVRGEDVRAAGEQLRATRPTAVNLGWGVDMALAAADPVAEAKRLAIDDVERNRTMGANGRDLLPDGTRVLTHCNTGSLATVGYGTALGVIRAAHEAGHRLHVWVDETRPVLQGARLTAWECQRLGIPATLVPDVMAGSLMASGDVDCAIVGADRITANGDVANKIGTYQVAVLCRHHGIPFYVAAPRSTFDLAMASGDEIEIELRNPAEVTTIGGVRIAPEGMDALNRAFDVTPAELVTAWITEDGVFRSPPFT